MWIIPPTCAVTSNMINGNTEGLEIFGKLTGCSRARYRDHVARLRHLPGQNELR